MSGRLLVSGLVVVQVLVFGNAAGAGVNAYPTEGRLVFSCACLESDGSEWLFTIAPDGRGLRTLPRSNGASYPRWSRDGRTIAFARDYRPAKSVWLYSVGVSKARRLTRPLGGTSDDSPAWSPRADALAFVRWGRSGGSGAALRTRVIRSGNSMVVQSGATTLAQPDWSPDGGRIAGTRAGGELWQVNADGSGLRRLAPRRITGDLPRWSPDGTRIAFLFRPEYGPESDSVRVLDLRSGRVTTVFEPGKDLGEVDTRSGEGLAWSPDGRWLAVLRTVQAECVDYDPTNENCDQPEVWIVSTTDNRRRRIFTGPQLSEGYGLDWRPRPSTSGSG